MANNKTIWLVVGIIILLLVILPKLPLHYPFAIGAQAITNFDSLPYFKDNTQVLQVSSYARDGMNWEYGFTGKWSYLYKEGANFVIFDETGPGAIYNSWMTGDSLNNAGRLLFYFDNEETPSIDTTISEFFSNAGNPVKGAISSTRYSYVPIMFKERLKIVMTSQPYFYHFTYHKYDSSISLTSGAEDYSGISQMWNNKGNHPTGDEGNEISADIKTIEAGTTETLLDYTGEYNYISTIKIDPTSADISQALKDVWINIYWDFETEPSVSAPIGEFFGSGIGERNVQSLPIGMTTNGYYYCYFPMPFSSSAKIQIVNKGSNPVTINYLIKAKKDSSMMVGKNAGYFNAKYNKEFPTTAEKDYTILETSGRGHFVGVIHTLRGLVTTAQSSDIPPRKRFLEGDERFFIDGQLSPSMHGTGTEDYYIGSYYYRGAPYTQALFGVQDTMLADGRFEYTTYRFQINDFVPFSSSAKLLIEHGLTNDIEADYSSVAFYYSSDVGRTLTDSLDIGDSTSESSHQYAIEGTSSEASNSFYYPGYDLNTHQQTSDNGKSFIGKSTFNLKINSNNKGVVLRRRLDYGLINQMADVYVDNQLVGQWYTAGMNDIVNPANTLRWLDSEFYIAPQYTQGKETMNIRIESDSWNEFYYWAYTIQCFDCQTVTPSSSGGGGGGGIVQTYSISDTNKTEVISNNESEDSGLIILLIIGVAVFIFIKYGKR